MTREEGLNNPMGLRRSHDVFKGETVSPDKDFKKFDTAVNGIRAGAKVLLTYQKHYGLKTIAEIIPRWAPATENDTEAYIADGCQFLGAHRDKEFDFQDLNQLASFCRMIIHHENGRVLYSALTVLEGAKDALSPA